MKRLTYIVISLLILSACSTIKIEKLNSNSEIKSNGFVYALPKTELNIEFKVVKTKSFKGPFSDYSDEYLGFDNVIESDAINYKIANINVIPSQTNDTSKLYFISGKSKNFKTFEYINNTLVLKSINIEQKNNETTCSYSTSIKNNITDDESYIPFKDITIKPLVIEKNDTIWKNILVDSVYKRVPKINKAIAPSTIKDQAFAASKFIFKIRKRRLRVITGMDEKFPSGKSINKIINELNKLEESYIELFTGKIMSDTIVYSYKITPNEHDKFTELKINYDNKNGFSDNSNNTIIISVSKQSQNNVLDNISRSEKTNNKFVYRLPENANLNIKFGNKSFLNKSIPVSQYGYLNFLNKNTLDKEVLFDEKSGNLIYIK